MKNDFLPVEYHLEVYEESLRNDPSFFVQSSSPLGAMSVGDFFNPAGADQWQSRPDGKEKFVIKQVEHIIWKIGGTHVTHKIMIVLGKVKIE